MCYSSNEKLKEIVEKKECLRWKLKGNVFDVDTTSETIKRRIVMKIDERYQDLQDNILDATTIGSLKNWPTENTEGTKNGNTAQVVFNQFVSYIFC